jgi:hypothetical protein
VSARARAAAGRPALFLARNQLGDGAVAALPGAPRMRRLELEMLALDDDTKDALRERWGDRVRF